MNEQNYNHRPDTSGKRRRSRDGSDGGGGPWKAMKRLRVVDHEKTSAAGTVHGGAAGRRPEHGGGSHPPNPPEQHHHHHQQEAGQNTTPEKGLEQYSPTTLKQNPQPSAAAAAHSADADYHNVNHILGALHLERREREQQQAAVHHHHHQTTTAAATPSQPRSYLQTPDHTYPRACEHSYQTPPPKPRKNKVVHLHTSSKLG
jgi:hypothetical protein